MGGWERERVSDWVGGWVGGWASEFGFVYDSLGRLAVTSHG